MKRERRRRKKWDTRTEGLAFPLLSFQRREGRSDCIHTHGLQIKYRWNINADLSWWRLPADKSSEAGEQLRVTGRYSWKQAGCYLLSGGHVGGRLLFLSVFTPKRNDIKGARFLFFILLSIIHVSMKQWKELLSNFLMNVEIFAVNVRKVKKSISWTHVNWGGMTGL